MSEARAPTAAAPLKPWSDIALPALTGVTMLAAVVMVFWVVPNEKVQVLEFPLDRLAIDGQPKSSPFQSDRSNPCGP